uniref:hypothetical protein n=1 Tax=Gelidibacter sp. TaxID=2018083 RepID=UPI00404B561E
MTLITQQTRNLKNLKEKINLFNLSTLKHIKNFIFVLLFFFFSAVNYAQTIKGFVQDVNGNPLNANVLIKDTSNPNIISEFSLVIKGKFSYTLKKKYNSDIIVEVTSAGYGSTEQLVKFKDLKTTIELNFKLFKEKIQELDEVVIEGKKKPFNIKGDTITYRVDSYKDGTEKKLEDLLKKLPGIEVNEENGLIKYRGKAIETVTIEGDNLFDYNYTIGTKNININLVEEIEAIENYSENSLLKGIEQSDKVALNLKLKEQKTDVSGNIDTGLGDYAGTNKMPVNASTNLLGINKLYKSFAVLTYNNTGQNLSPFNYFDSQINSEQIKEQDYYAQNIIPELNLTQITNDNLSNVNNQLFGNFNSIFNISNKLKTKINLFYIKDDINSNQFSENRYRINNETFTTFDDFYISKTPIQYRGDLELKLITSKSSLLLYNVSLRDEAIETDRTILSNQENDFTSFLKTKNTFFKQRLQYTKRISDKKALQVSFLQSINSLLQNYNIAPSIFNFSDADNDIQNNNSKKNYLDFNVTLLAARKNDNYTFAFGSSLSNDPFKSNLFSQNDTETFLIENGKNDLEYRKNEIYTLGSYNWKTGKFKIIPNYSLKYLFQDLDYSSNISSMNSSLIIFEPSLNIVYKLNQISSLDLNLGLNNNSNSLQNLFPNNVLINNRLVLRNISNISLQKNQTFGLFYNKNDLFNQLEMSFGINYFKQKGNFFSNSQIDANSIAVENFFLPEANESINVNFNFSKLIPYIKTTLKVNSTYSTFNYKNIVNNSELRNNKSNYIANQVFLKTAFKSIVNFENKTNHTYQENLSENIFKNSSFQNKFKIIFKPTMQVYGAFTFDYFIPSLESKTNNYSFLGAKVWYKPENKNWELNLTGTNLNNIKSFEQFNTNDISTSIYRISLLNRFIMMNFTYNF